MNPRPTPSYFAWFCFLAVLGLTLDQASKYTVFGWLAPNQEIVIVPQWFSIVHHPTLNQGALFSLGSGIGSWANGGFALVSAAAALAILAICWRPMITRDPMLSIALGLILGGALGNCWDRVVLGGVRDFFWAYYLLPSGERLTWPIFNVADCCLVGGAFGLGYHALFVGEARPQANATPAAPATPHAGG